MNHTAAKTRTAIVFGNGITRERVERFLPGNYAVVDADITGSRGDSVIVAGYDHAGWTLDGYVLPRLASGAMFGEEVEPWVEACDEVAPVRTVVDPDA